MADESPETKERMRRRHENYRKLTEGKSQRFKRRIERVESLSEATDVPRVRVLPKNDAFRKWLKHPLTDAGFRETGSVEWPMDTFTSRRLRDGDVTLEHGQQTPVAAARPGRGARPEPPKAG